MKKETSWGFLFLCGKMFLVLSNCRKTVSSCFLFQVIAQRPLRHVSRFKQLPKDHFALFLVSSNCPKTVSPCFSF